MVETLNLNREQHIAAAKVWGAMIELQRTAPTDYWPVHVVLYATPRIYRDHAIHNYLDRDELH